MPPATTTDGARARAHDAVLFGRAADRVVTLPFGRVRAWDGEPRHRDHNAVRVMGPPPADLITPSARGQADRPQRFVELEGRDHPPPEGWDADVIAHLCFAGAPRPAEPL